MAVALESDFTLKDGTTVHIRPIQPGDDHALIEIFKHLSPQSVYQRFFQALPELSPGMATYLANAHYTDRMALVAEAGGEMIGVGRYERTDDPTVADLALVLLDEWQNRGLGRILLREILKVGKSNGIERFHADVLAENRRMLRLLAQESEILEQKTEAGIAEAFLVLRREIPNYCLTLDQGAYNYLRSCMPCGNQLRDRNLDGIRPVKDGAHRLRALESQRSSAAACTCRD